MESRKDSKFGIDEHPGISLEELNVVLLCINNYGITKRQ